MSLGASWGVTGSERLEPFPCDASCAAPDEALFRGVTVAAPPPVLFRWLCQLRTAPYSYDWLDNGGRQSPRTLTPGLDVLAKGQRVMTIFELVDFEPDRSLTIVNRARDGARRLFGEVWVSYVIRPGQGADCRLLAKLVVRYPRAITGWALRRVLPLGDLLMMRRQLLNLKKLAERDARGAASPRGAT
jgi:hypothetical protein